MVSKYRSKRTEIDGISFASKKEAKRYSELKLLERAGHIRQLTLQPRFPLKVGGQLICTYVADFAYFDQNARVIEDSKGFRTREYIIKAKLLKALNPGIDFREV